MPAGIRVKAADGRMTLPLAHTIVYSRFMINASVGVAFMLYWIAGCRPSGRERCLVNVKFVPRLAG